MGSRDRPSYHITAPRNWLNDPNGPVRWKGTYHLFFQHNPTAPRWGRPHWGHVASSDLVRWEHRGVALAPSETGPDRDGCWSGCVRIVDGVPTAFYTGVSGTDPARRVEAVCRATGSQRLTDWEKDPAPLIDGAPPGHPAGAHRDPFVFRDGDRWTLLVGASVPDSPGSQRRRGSVLAYHSEDLARWEYGGEFLRDPGTHAVTSGSSLWECPQLVRLRGWDVLIVSLQDPRRRQPLLHPVWFVGEVTGSGFAVSRAGRIDGGDVLYAPAVLERVGHPPLLWGWVRELGPEETLTGEPFAGALSLPRELRVRAGRLELSPARELGTLRSLGTDGAVADRTVLRRGEGWSVLAAHPHWELELCCDGPIELLLAGPQGDLLHRTTLRSTGGLRHSHGGSVHPEGVCARIFVDRDILEVFPAGGVPATGRLARHGPPALGVTLRAPEPVSFSRLRLHALPTSGLVTA